MKKGSSDAADCFSEGSSEFNEGAQGHAAAGSDWKAQGDQMAKDAAMGAGTMSKCFNKGADDTQKGFGGRK